MGGNAVAARTELSKPDLGRAPTTVDPSTGGCPLLRARDDTATLDVRRLAEFGRDGD
jgi:hypothetical protein